MIKDKFIKLQRKALIVQETDGGCLSTSLYTLPFGHCPRASPAPYFTYNCIRVSQDFLLMNLSWVFLPMVFNKCSYFSLTNRCIYLMDASCGIMSMFIFCIFIFTLCIIILKVATQSARYQ